MAGVGWGFEGTGGVGATTLLLLHLLLTTAVLLLLLLLLLPQVVQGIEVVKAMEACGSRSGDTSFDVMIAACGELTADDGGAAPSAGGAASAPGGCGRAGGRVYGVVRERAAYLRACRRCLSLLAAACHECCPVLFGPWPAVCSA